MTDGETPPVDRPDSDTHEGNSGFGGEQSPGLSTSGLLAGASRRLARHPGAVVALVVAGVVVAGADWVQLHGPVPTTGYEGVQQGQFTVAFFVMVTVVSRAGVPASALVDLRPEWLAATLGLELLEVGAIALASGYALARLLDVDRSVGALLRYGLVVALLRVGFPRADVEGGAILLALPLLIAVFVVLVRLVPLPGLVVRGETLPTALGRSWALTRGHGWALLGVVLALGLSTHLLASVPVVGPVGASLVAAVHAGVVATVLVRLDGTGQPVAVSNRNRSAGGRASAGGTDEQ